MQLRCMSISPDGRLLAAGDMVGNVWVYTLPSMKLLLVQEAHDGEVMCLAFASAVAANDGTALEGRVSCSSAQHSRHSSGSGSGGGVRGSKRDPQHGAGLAASGGGDGLIHVYDASDGFRLLETLDEHSGAVRGLCFTGGGKGLVSCSSDHCIIFRCEKETGNRQKRHGQSCLAGASL